MPDSFEISSSDSALPPWIRHAWPPERQFLRGLGAPDWAKPAIAIVGSTRPSPLARSWAFALGRAAAARDWSVVSGLAVGIDTEAHKGAISGGGHTLAVVAHGLEFPLIRSRRQMFDRILEAGGAIVSISESAEPPTRERLLLRNKWTSAFSLAVVAVQSRGRDGTLATMRHAFNQNRLLATFAQAPDEQPESWKGNRLLLGSDPPWKLARSAAYPWQPAYRLRGEPDVVSLFHELDELVAYWQRLETDLYSESLIQAKLLDARARMEIAQ